MTFRKSLLAVFITCLTAVFSLHASSIPNKIELKQKARSMRAKKPVSAKMKRALAKAQQQQGQTSQSCANDGCCSCYVIRPCDFGANSDTTYFITAPGKYTLQQDVVFYPADDFTPAINILSDNVTLDLCSHTLSQGNDTPFARGIQIGQGYDYDDPDFVLKNIEIRDGSIVDFTGIGVFCYNASFDEPSGELAFEDIRLFTLNILDCGSSPTNDFGSGIDFDSSADSSLYDLDVPVAYKNVRIEGCNVNRCLGNSSITVYTVDDLLVTNTTANDLTSTVSTVFGDDYGPSAYLVYARNLEITNCQGNNAQNLDPETTNALTGAFFESSINVIMQNCQFNDNFGESDFIATGAFMSNLQNGLIENCQFNNTRGGDLNTIANGLHMSDGTFQETEGNSVKFINCQFNGMTHSPTGTSDSPIPPSLAGVRCITIRNMVFEDCQASNIGTLNPNYRAFGFLVGTNAEDPTPEFASSRNLTFKNCIASDITSVSDQAAGFYISGENRDRVAEQSTLFNTVLEECIAERITSGSSTDVVAGIINGIRDQGVTDRIYPAIYNLYIKNCRVSDVHSNSEDQSPLSAGIIAYSVHDPVISENSVTGCDRGILFTGTCDIIPNGFQLAATFEDAVAFPPIPIDIGTPGGPSELESFYNNNRSSNVQVLIPDDVDSNHDFLFPTNADLTALHWKSGDVIIYSTEGGPTIPGLVNGQTYYAIVYRPGFTTDGLVVNNNVTKCLISGYQDDRSVTSSAWINNIALLNGTPTPSHKANFAIRWPNHEPQVDEGTLGKYPKNPNKNFNTSLIRAKHHHHHHSHSHH